MIFCWSSVLSQLCPRKASDVLPEWWHVGNLALAPRILLPGRRRWWQTPPAPNNSLKSEVRESGKLAQFAYVLAFRTLAKTKASNSSFSVPCAGMCCLLPGLKDVGTVLRLPPFNSLLCFTQHQLDQVVCFCSMVLKFSQKGSRNLEQRWGNFHLPRNNLKGDLIQIQSMLYLQLSQQG